MHANNLAQRALCPLFDVAAFLTVWAVASMTILTLLSLRWPDNPWGNMAFGVIVGLLCTTAGFTVFEATGHGAGRTLFNVKLENARTGRPLSEARRVVRSLAKYAAAIGLLIVAVDLPNSNSPAFLLPFAAAAVANTAVILSRNDRRSVLDLIAGSRSH